MSCQSYASRSQISIIESDCASLGCSFPLTYAGVPIVKGKGETSYFYGLIEIV